MVVVSGQLSGDCTRPLLVKLTTKASQNCQLATPASCRTVEFYLTLFPRNGFLCRYRSLDRYDYACRPYFGMRKHDPVNFIQVGPRGRSRAVAF